MWILIVKDGLILLKNKKDAVLQVGAIGMAISMAIVSPYGYVQGISGRDNFQKLCLKGRETTKITENVRNIEQKCKVILPEETPMPTPNVEENISDSMNYEKEWFYKVVFAEAGYCDLDEQEAVALAIWNRADHKLENIVSEVNKENQFSVVKNGKVYAWIDGEEREVTMEDITDVTFQAVQNVIDGKETEVERLLKEEAARLGLDQEEYAEGGPIYFYNPEYCSDAENAKRVNVQCKVQVGQQTFYKSRG